MKPEKARLYGEAQKADRSYSSWFLVYFIAQLVLVRGWMKEIDGFEGTIQQLRLWLALAASAERRARFSMLCSTATLIFCSCRAYKIPVWVLHVKISNYILVSKRIVPG